jgi:hypothetical protein
VMGVVAAWAARELASQAALPALLGTALAGAIAYAIVVLPALGFRWPRALQEA